jgi:hypothetical protein
MPLGLLGEIPVVAHANFPLTAPITTPRWRLVGFDGREIMGTAVNLLQQLREGKALTENNGKVSARADYEIETATAGVSVV